MKKIIGLVGETGSGKDTFCNHVKENHQNVFCFRFSQPLSEMLGIFFNEIKKEDQQWLVGCLRQRFGNNILGEAMAKKIKNMEDGLIIVNGIRMKEELELIKGLRGKIIYITADQKKRWERITLRGEKSDDNCSFEKFLEMEKAPSEVLIASIGNQADFKIENNDSKESFFQEVKKTIDLI